MAYVKRKSSFYGNIFHQIIVCMVVRIRKTIAYKASDAHSTPVMESFANVSKLWENVTRKKEINIEKKTFLHNI